MLCKPSYWLSGDEVGDLTVEGVIKQCVSLVQSDVSQVVHAVHTWKKYFSLGELTEGETIDR